MILTRFFICLVYDNFVNCRGQFAKMPYNGRFFTKWNEGILAG